MVSPKFPPNFKDSQKVRVASTHFRRAAFFEPCGLSLPLHASVVFRAFDATDACQETRANPEEVERLTSCEREYLLNIQRIGVAPQIQLLAVNRQRGHAISELIALNAVMPPHMVNR